MKCLLSVTLLTLLLAVPVQTEAGAVSFEEAGQATQAIISPLFGSDPIIISAPGFLDFTVDVSANFANVTSLFKGTDLPDPLNLGGFLTYDLYNTVTTGTASQNGDGSYNVALSLLFELKITSGLFTGLTLETLQDSVFTNANIASLPFPVGTSFSQPSQPDLTGVYIKTDPTGVFSPGTFVGYSFDRVVTITPEPSTVISAALGVAGLVAMTRSRRKSSGNAAQK